MVGVVSVMLCGCSETELQESVEDTIVNQTAGIIEPQSNQRDYLIQDYNVKKPKDVSISSLSKYDMSGPDYAGISEIVSNLEAADSTESVTESSDGVCLSTYHEKKNDTKKGGYECVKPEYSSTIISSFSKTDFYKKGGYTSETDCNEFLIDVFNYVKSTKASEQTGRAEVRSIVAKLVSDNQITGGYAFAAERYYRAEVNTTAKMTEVFGDNFGYVVADTSVNSGLSFTELSAFAARSGVSAHVIVSYNVPQVSGNSNTSGWAIYYKDGNDSKDLAEKICESLRSDKSLTEATSKEKNGNRVKYEGCRCVDDYFGNPDMFVVLNYAEVPTVIVSLGDDTTVTAEMAQKIAEGIMAWR